MRYRRLGHSGLKVSVVGLGGNTFGRSTDEVQTAHIVHAALDLGITFFDTAEVYNKGVSEEHLGQALSGRRDRAIVATKVGWELGDAPHQRGVSRARIMAAVQGSLRRLNMDYVDLLQIHKWDPETPLEESLSTLSDLVRQGKVRYVGCSNFAAWQLAWGLWISDRRHWPSFVSVQPEYNLLARRVEAELLPACQALGVGVIPYFPLAGGLLTGKYLQGQPAPPGTRGYQSERFQQLFMTPRNFAIVHRLEEWAKSQGRTVTELAVAWLIARPAVSTVITGATNTKQIEANARAADWEMTQSEVEDIAAVAPP